MPFKKIMKGEPPDLLAAEGLLFHDCMALSPSQQECTARLGMTIQMEQEAYLTEHPEVIAMLEVFVSKITRLGKRKGILKEAALHFTRSAEILDREIRERLGLSSRGPYIKQDKQSYRYHDLDLKYDLKNIITKHYPYEEWKILTPIVPTPDTASSSFMSVITSDTTLPTPDPIPSPEPTLSETMFAVVSNTVDKAIYLHVDDAALRYDIAYMEVMKVVEEAMEIPIIEIKELIAELFFNSYKMFEINIMEKERIDAEIAWEKRMRKKMKRTLRRLNNFKGYETPPTPTNVASTHESYKEPSLYPSVCPPQFKYNRYPKDHFGIYLPMEMKYADRNMTTTPSISLENLTEPDNDEKTNTELC